MATIKKMLLNDLDIVPIRSVRLGMISDEEKLKRSAWELTQGKITSGNVPLEGGLADPRSGATDTAICATCRADMSVCPGHFGHLKLAVPVFSPAFFTPYLKKLLECVCWGCHKLLLEGHRVPPMTMPPRKRFHHIYKICHDRHSSASNKKVTCHHCLMEQPTIIKNANATNALNLHANIGGADDTKGDNWISAEVVYNILRGIPNQDSMTLGFDRRYNAPESLVWKVLVVPPPTIRPAVRFGVGGARGEDDITMVLREIFKINTKLNTLLAKPINDPATAQSIRSTTIELQHAITALVDNEHGIRPLAQSRSGKPYKTISSRLGGKTGRLRANLLGKRVNHSARTVASADPCLSINEVGVPYKVAMNLTVPEVVTAFNIKRLRTYVENGPWKHPGAVYYKQRDQSLKYSIVEGRPQELMPGDVVYRHLVNGDPVLVNRQPTLHRLSMMTHLVRVLPQNTIRISVAVTDAYAGDFDGDEFNMHVHQSVQTASELLHLSQPHLQMLRPRNARPCICIKQDVPIAMYYMSKMGSLLAKDAANIACTMNDRSYGLVADVMKKADSSVLKPTDLFTMLFHPNLNVNVNGGKFAIENGCLVKGVLGAEEYKAYSNGVLHTVISEFGAEEARNLLDNTQKVSIEWLMQFGFSVGIRDLLLTPENTQAMKVARASITEKARAVVAASRSKDYSKLDSKRQFSSASQRFESEMGEACDIGEIEKIFAAGIDSGNRFKELIVSGSKGKIGNLMNMVGVIGQQLVQGARIKPEFDSRTTPHFCKFDNGIEARGFVRNCYISGLDPTEFFFAAIKGREGLLDTALSTSECGYAQRKLVKAMEDLRISHELLVVDANDNIIQFAYGEDGLDVGKTEQQSLHFVGFSTDEFKKEYGWDEAEMKEHTSAASVPAATVKAIYEFYQYTRKDVLDTVCRGVLPSKGGVPPIDCAVNVNKMLLNFKTSSTKSDLSYSSLCKTVENFAVDNLYMYKLGNGIIHGGVNTLINALILSLGPREVIIRRHWTMADLTRFLDGVKHRYYGALAYPGEMVGILAAQSIGEQVTQATLNTFKAVKSDDTILTLAGIPRIKEILAFTPSIKMPAMSFRITEESMFEDIRKRVEHLRLGNKTLMKDFKVLYCTRQKLAEVEALASPFKETFVNKFKETLGDDVPGWHIVIDFNPHHFATKVLTIQHVENVIYSNITVDVQVYTELPLVGMNPLNPGTSRAIKMILALNLANTVATHTKPVGKAIAAGTLADKDTKIYPDLFSDIITLKDSLEKVTIAGMEKVTRMMPSGKPEDVRVLGADGEFVTQTHIKCATEGSDILAMMALNGVVSESVCTNDFYDVLNTLGIEAAKYTIVDEMTKVLGNTSYNEVAYRHILLLADFSTSTGGFTSFERFGFAKSDRAGPMAKASFERTSAMLIDAAAFGEVDNMAGVSANLIFGQLGKGGTAVSEVLLDSKKLELTTETTFDEELYGNEDDDMEPNADEVEENSMRCKVLFRNFDMDVDLSRFKTQPFLH